jgi:soluble lytic murein transglycosylase-like protein
MQLMPQTAKRYGVTNSFDPDQNIRGGVAHLRDLLDTNGGDTRLAVAAYNAGAGAVDKYSGVPPYKETRQYVKSVLGKMHGSGGHVKTAAPAPTGEPVRKLVDASGTISLVN